MKVAVLFSGGKDSCYACYKAMQEHKVVCLISVISKNKESYMFHTPNITLTDLQAKAMEIPLIKKETKGEKEVELEDLKTIIKEAKNKFKIEGVVTGALASEYQASRIKTICEDLNLESINPLWNKEQDTFIKELINKKFEVMIVAVACEGLDESWLGKVITRENLPKLLELSEKYQFNAAFEGGEAETLVVNAPFFKKRINILKAKPKWHGSSGIFIIEKAELA